MEQLISVDDYLLKNDLNERTICHRLAVYLEQLYPDYHVDIEYNRDHEPVKDFDKQEFINKLIKEYRLSNKYDKNDVKELVEKQIEEGSTRRVLPDIIVHRRGTDDNKVVLEIKKSNNLGDDGEKDKAKLKLYEQRLHNSEAYFVALQGDDDFTENEVGNNYSIESV